MCFVRELPHLLLLTKGDSGHAQLAYPMQNPVKERIPKLREEIAEINEANRLYLQGGKRKSGATSDQLRRLQRLQEILNELVRLTDWKKL